MDSNLSFTCVHILKISCVLISVLWVFVQCSHVYENEVLCHPEQVHISFGDSLSEMVIMWSTKKNCTCKVAYGTDPWKFDLQSDNGEMKYFSELNPNGLQYIHRVKLKNLKPSTTYFYRPISTYISSGPFYFHTPTEDPTYVHEFLVYGDLGAQSDSIPFLDTEALSGHYSAVLHIGDFAYNMMDEGGKVGDVFMQLTEGISSRLPYMTAVGNHEIDQDTFAHYRHRFSMPGSDWPIPVDKMWYSWDIGLVHFIGYSSEVFFTSNGVNIPKQRDWLIKDLEKANKNRDKQPWVIAYGHRPMYCSNNDQDDCTKKDSKVRAGLEDIFYNYGVDLVLQAHEHSYERLWPQYKGVVLANNYQNPQAPVQIISGAAGSKHNTDNMKPQAANWSAVRSDIPAFDSFGRLKIYNVSHIYWEQVHVNTSKVIDTVWISQTNHGPFKEDKLTPEVTHEIEKQKEETNKIIQASKPETETPNNDMPAMANASGAFNDPKTKIVIGACAGVLVLIIIITIIFIVKIRQRKPKKYRRWEQTVDYGRKFYSSYEHVGNNEKDTDDFEVEVTDGGNLPTSKLLSDGDR